MKKEKATPIEGVIKERLKLQSTQRNLFSKWGITSDIKFFQTEAFSSTHSKWSSLEKKQFYIVLGGRMNFKKTEDFINSCIASQKNLN